MHGRDGGCSGAARPGVADGAEGPSDRGEADAAAHTCRDTLDVAWACEFGVLLLSDDVCDEAGAAVGGAPLVRGGQAVADAVLPSACTASAPEAAQLFTMLPGILSLRRIGYEVVG